MTATELADAFFQSIIGRDSDPQRGRKVFATAEASLNLRISIYEAALRGIKKGLGSSLAWHVARIDEFKRNLTDIDTVRANVAKRRGKIKAELESLAKLSPEEIHAMAVAMRKPKVKKTKKPPKRKEGQAATHYSVMKVIHHILIGFVFVGLVSVLFGAVPLSPEAKLLGFILVIKLSEFRRDTWEGYR